MAEPTVHVYLDYQNVHLSVVEAFGPHGAPPHTTLVHPGKYADALMAARLAAGRGGVLEVVHVYRGLPSSRHQVRPAARNKAQAAEWERDRRVKVYSRPAQIPARLAQFAGSGKGCRRYVGGRVCAGGAGEACRHLVLASRDTDLMPVLEDPRSY
jgi:hypothetical protein